MKALETYGYQGAKSLHQAALEKYGSEEEVAHQIRLLNRRLRYAATQSVTPRNFPTDADFIRAPLPSGRLVVIPRKDWGTASYVAWFEQANNLKPTTGAQA